MEVPCSPGDLPLRVTLNGKPFGAPNAGVDMTFSFAQLIAHAAKTRALGAGSIVGSGTVSNKHGDAGSCCIAERRSLEQIEKGAADIFKRRHGEIAFRPVDHLVGHKPARGALLGRTREEGADRLLHAQRRPVRGAGPVVR